MLAEISEASPEMFRRMIDLPTIIVDEVPEDAIAKLEDALGRDIPDDFGQFTVFEASRLGQAQEAVKLFNRFELVVGRIVTRGTEPAEPREGGAVVEPR